jgi:hypothetical protein
MKAQLLMLSTAGLLLAAGASRAEPNPAIRDFLTGVAAQADARLSITCAALPGQTVRVRGAVSDGRLNGLRMAASTGDLNADQMILRSLRLMRVKDVPAELSGRELILTLRVP